MGVQARTLTTRVGAFDGLRGLAIAAVLLFHAQISWARGGFLGVSAFFTLSGYLITSLLLDERARTGAVSLRTFWSRRARRLLPAAYLAIAGILLFGATVATVDQLRSLRGDVVSDARVRRQLALLLHGPELPAVVCGAVAGAALLVALDRRTVLHRVPARAARRSADHAGPPASAGCVLRGGDHRVGRREHRVVLTVGRVARLLRHRHARRRTSRRRLARRFAARPGAPPRDDARACDRDRRRFSRARHHLVLVGNGQPDRELAVPRRLRVARDAGRDRDHGRSSRRAASRARSPPARSNGSAGCRTAFTCSTGRSTCG